MGPQASIPQAGPQQAGAMIPRKAAGRWDAVVVGSGFGGAVVAARLAQKGWRVAVLERGRHWGREDFPRPGVSKPRDWWWSEKTRGLYEVVRGRRLSLLVASGVGGGSLIYTNIQKRAPAETFAASSRPQSPNQFGTGRGWPASYTRAALDPYYDRVFEMLTPSPLPGPLPKTARFQEAATRLALEQLALRTPRASPEPSRGAQSRGEVEGRFSRPDLAIYWGEQGEQIVNRFGAPQSACIRCGLCMVGCHVHAKNTLDLNYLKLAEQHGAEIFPLHEVESFEPVAYGYLVRFRRYYTDPPERDSISATRALVLAAGTLGTNRLLLRARDFDRTLPHLSPQLGCGFSDNGDFFGALLAAGDVQPAFGPTVTALLDFWNDGRFLVFDGGLPDFLAPRYELRLRLLRALGSIRAWFARGPHPGPQPQRAFDSLLPLFLMGLDAADGRLYLDPKARLQIDWKHTQSEALFRRMREQIRALARALGASSFDLWSRGFGIRRRLWGVHPLGGCALAERPEQGVVNEAGEVFGYPGLYVADGSLIPTALGVPPSMTIAALAERIAEAIR